jgi:CBS domain-containing protein
MRSTAIHDTLSKGSLSWIYLIIFIIKLTYYSAAFAQPQGKQMPERDARVWKPFLVDLKINQQKVGSAFVWQHEDEKDWLLPVDLLQRSRVRIPSTAPRIVQERIDYVSTASLGKVDTHFSEENQILSIDLAPNAFEASSIKVPINSLAGTPSMAAGTVINYDLSLSTGSGPTTEFLSTELSTGIGSGVFVVSQAYLHNDSQDRFIRLDTNYTLDQPEKLTTLRLGDAISRPATTLGRSVRFAGIQYGSNFRVQPGLITAPLASLPLGILTDRDILVQTIALDVEARPFTASDLMSSPVTTVLEDAGLTEALGVMRGKRIRRLPVVNRSGGLVGMVTTDDLLDLLAAELSMLAGLVVEQPIKEERTRK